MELQKEKSPAVHKVDHCRRGYESATYERTADEAA